MFLPVTHYRQLHATNTPHTRPTPSHTHHTYHTHTPAHSQPHTTSSTHSPQHTALIHSSTRDPNHTGVANLCIHTASPHTTCSTPTHTRGPSPYRRTEAQEDVHSKHTGVHALSPRFLPSLISLLFLSQPVHTLKAGTTSGLGGSFLPNQQDLSCPM